LLLNEPLGIIEIPERKNHYGKKRFVKVKRIKNKMNKNRLDKSFFEQDVLKIAPELLGKFLVRAYDRNRIERFKITETEAYRGEEDLGCHASKGRTARTEVMYSSGGVIYIYLIYGMHWMLNFVTGKKDQPQAVLIRGLEGIYGPGEITKKLQIDKDFYGESLITSSRIWIENTFQKVVYSTDVRIGINYAGEFWEKKQWRFILKF